MGGLEKMLEVPGQHQHPVAARLQADKPFVSLEWRRRRRTRRRFVSLDELPNMAVASIQSSSDVLHFGGCSFLYGRKGAVTLR